MTATTIEWVGERFTEQLAAILEEHASELFGLLGDDERLLWKGLKHLDAAALLRPPPPESLLLRARILASLEKSGDAARILRDLSRKNPGDPRVLSELASVMEDSGDLEAARAAHEEALAVLSPTDPEAEYIVLGYATCLAEAGQRSKAIRVVLPWVDRLRKARRRRGALQAWLKKTTERAP
jgi:tetratricopeptide (TPR) repeat protein